jgi:hypothetical protein
MKAYLNRRNIILAALPAAILFYFSPLVLGTYLFIAFLLILICLLFSPDPAVKVGNVIANTATPIVTLFILMLVLEIALHVQPHLFIGGQKPDTLGEFSDYTSRGYLTKEVFKKEKGVFRILSLGDSFAVYAPDNNKNLNYNALLQEKYAALSGQKVEIVNAGMPSVGPGYYWRVLENFGDRINPDLVLVGFFLGNDFYEFEFNIIIGELIYEPYNLKKKLWGYQHFKSSRLFKLLRHNYFLYRERERKTQEISKTGGISEGTFSNESFLEIAKGRTWIFRKDKQVDLESKWRQGSLVIAQMKQWSDKRRVPMVLVIFPDQLQVDKDLREEISQIYGINENSLNLDYPNRLLQTFCRKNNIHCLDLLGPFQNNPDSQHLYALRDTHWNEAGNRLAANLIFQYLEDQKLIKSD